MRWVNILAALCISMMALTFVSGCASANYGNQNLTADKVGQIKKGITTKAEVIELLGQPDYVGMMADGRRTMTYSGVQASSDSSDSALLAVPVIGPIIPEHHTQTTHRQSLQIILGSDDIVQDYEYSDNASETDTTVSVFGGSGVQQKAIPPDAPH